MRSRFRKSISIITTMALLLSCNLAPLEVIASDETRVTSGQELISTEEASGVSGNSAEGFVAEVRAEGDALAEGTYVPGEVIVVFDKLKAFRHAEEIAEEAAQSVAESTLCAADAEADEELENIKATTLSRTDRAVLLTGDEELDELALCEALEGVDGVEFAQPNYIYTPDAKSTNKTNDEYFEDQWNLDYIDAKEAWNLIDKLRTQKSWNKSKHPRVKIATLDTGANTGHEDFADISEGGNLDKSNCVTVSYTGKGADGEDLYESVPYTITSGVHGTHTASIIAATSNNGKGVAGVAAGNNNDLIELMAIDVFPSFDKNLQKPSQAEATTADVVAGLDYAVKNGAQVVVMCLGHSRDSLDGNGGRHDDNWLHEKIKWAVNEKDVVICCSAGNDNTDAEWLPSDFEEVISCINTVKYTDIESEDCRNSKSNYGPQKDISAPGTKVTMVNSGSSSYATTSGTSFAAPTVAAVAAMVRYVNPSLSQKQVKDLLYKTTIDLYEKGWDELTGWGNVNAYNAVSAAAGLNKTLEVDSLKTPTVKAESAGNNKIKLSWENDENVRRYYIFRSTKAKKNYMLIAAVDNGYGEFVDETAAFNKQYYYKIQASSTSDDGKRMTSARSKYATQRAICGGVELSALVTSGTSAEINWTASEGASGYKLYIKTSKKSGYKCILTVKGNDGETAVIEGLREGKTYYYKLRPYVVKKKKTYYGKYSKVLSLKQEYTEEESSL